MAFGTAWLALLGLSYLRQPPERIAPEGLLAVGCVALTLAGGFNIHRRHTVELEFYAVKSTVTTMIAADWWRSDWQRVPARRIDFTGGIEEPLTIQWAGSLQGIEDILLRKGWHASIPWTASSALTWLTAEADMTQLPVLPFLAGGRLPSLILVQQHGDRAPAGSRLVLRMWAVAIEVTNGRPSPLWIGSVVEERLSRPFSLITLAWTQPDMNGPREVLAAALDGGHLVARTDGVADADWDGHVLLACENNVQKTEYQ